MLVLRVVIVLLLRCRNIMMVETEKTLDEEHREESAKNPKEDRVHGIRRFQQCMGKQMKKPHSQHHSCDQTHGYLHPPMRQANKQRDPTSC